MELSISKTKGKAETIEVSDLAFGKDFNQDLVHQTVTAYLAGARQGTRAQKIVLQFLVAEENLGIKKVLAVLELELFEAQFGVQVVLHSQPNHKIILRK